MIESIRKPRLARPGAMATILVLVAAAISAVPAVAAGPYGYGGRGSGAAASAAPAAAAAPGSIQVGTMPTSTLGVVLTGPNGMTLYTLSSDPNNGSVCTGQCLTFWPPLLVASGGAVTGPSGGSLTFATFTRADDGTTQVAADGRAIYYFKNDTAPGQSNGEGVKGAGGVWHVASAAATSAVASAAPAAATPATGGYGALPGSAAAAATTNFQQPGTSDMAFPIGLLVLVVILALMLVAFVGIRRMGRVRNG
jgi:predicted lipoprotein with Yx(FWY)xxD motif